MVLIIVSLQAGKRNGKLPGAMNAIGTHPDYTCSTILLVDVVSNCYRVFSGNRAESIYHTIDQLGSLAAVIRARFAEVSGEYA